MNGRETCKRKTGRQYLTFLFILGTEAGQERLTFIDHLLLNVNFLGSLQLCADNTVLNWIFENPSGFINICFYSVSLVLR